MIDILTLKGPLAGPGGLQVFRSEAHAVTHMADHLLTSPESHAWAILMPDFSELLQTRAAFRLARSAAKLLEASSRDLGDRPDTSTHDATAGRDETCLPGLNELYDAYAQQIRTALDDAHELSWTWKSWHHLDERYAHIDTHAFGLNGVMAVFSRRHVRTAYLPGQGRVEGMIMTESTEQDRTPHALPRQIGGDADGLSGRGWGMRRKKRDRRRRGEGGREDSPPDSLGERHRLFRNCAKHVRSDYLGASYLTDGDPCAPDDFRKALRDIDNWAALFEDTTFSPNHRLEKPDRS